MSNLQSSSVISIATNCNPILCPELKFLCYINGGMISKRDYAEMDRYFRQLKIAHKHELKQRARDLKESIKQFEKECREYVPPIPLKNLSQVFHNMKSRCNDPQSKGYRYYGGRGIKCLLTYGQLRDIWERDKGWMFRRPSIDRIDTNGHYIKDNCRFIEMSENIKKSHQEKKMRKIGFME